MTDVAQGRTLTASPTIALQLYSIRRQVEKDFSGSFARVREAGFETVELYNIVAWKEQLLRELKANGLSAPTAHARLTDGDQDEILDAAAELGVRTIIDPKVAADRWTTTTSVDRIVDDLSSAAANAATRGLDFAYHNHAWEVVNSFGGQTALEYLAQRLPAGAGLEVDAYWAAIGGADVPELLQRLGHRVRFLHVKDAPRIAGGSLSTDRMDQMPVGEGALDWPAILAAAPAAELYVVEFDEFRGDVIAASGRSLRALTAFGARP